MYTTICMCDHEYMPTQVEILLLHVITKPNHYSDIIQEHFTIHMTTQELSSSGARRRQEQSVVKQRGMMHSYIEFAHVVCLVALPEHHCVQ